jgi:hypothetical protein
MKTIHSALCSLAFLFLACSKNTYPCPDIDGGTEVVKAGQANLKSSEPDMNGNGQLTKKPYAHRGMKKKKR